MLRKLTVTRLITSTELFLFYLMTKTSQLLYDASAEEVNIALESLCTGDTVDVSRQSIAQRLNRSHA